MPKPRSRYVSIGRSSHAGHGMASMAVTRRRFAVRTTAPSASTTA